MPSPTMHKPARLTWQSYQASKSAYSRRKAAAGAVLFNMVILAVVAYFVSLFLIANNA